MLDALRRSGKRARKRYRWKVYTTRFLLMAIALVAWQTFAGVPGHGMVVVDKFDVSTPLDIWSALKYYWYANLLWPNILVTVHEMILGFGLGVVAGVLVGFLVGANRFVSDVITPYITMLYSVPRLALMPLFLLWFGLGSVSKIAFVTMLVFFLVFYNTHAGVREVDQELIDTIGVMGARRVDRYVKVILPASTAWILAGMRLSAPYALVGAITSEMISSNAGIGFLLIQASQQFFTEGVFATIVVTVALALSLNALITLAERYLLGWRRRGVG